MDVNRDIKQHFSRFQKYITPNGVTYYHKKDYDNYMKNYNDYMKKYKTISDDESSKK
jgi:Holliday junction resolvase RusA-like endonuclease